MHNNLNSIIQKLSQIRNLTRDKDPENATGLNSLTNEIIKLQ
jgi:hypothetical protein